MGLEQSFFSLFIYHFGHFSIYFLISQGIKHGFSMKKSMGEHNFGVEPCGKLKLSKFRVVKSCRV